MQVGKLGRGKIILGCGKIILGCGKIILGRGKIILRGVKIYFVDRKIASIAVGNRFPKALQLRK